MTPRQHELLTFIRSQIEETGVCPSFQEMADAIGNASKHGVHRMVECLVADGYLLRRKSTKWRGLRLPTPNLRTVPSEALIAELQRRGEEVARW